MRSTLHRVACHLLVLTAVILWPASAAAELYKWVDERGVTNYSSKPPAAAATSSKLTRVENKISVYTPDDGVMQAVKAIRERSIQALTEPEPPRSPVARIAVERPAYENCVMSGRIGCEDLYPQYSPAAYYPLGRYGVRPVQPIAPTRFVKPPVTPVDTTRVARSPVR